jgi:hypothetical protein|tara:strand:+ start:129 stop:401 length:273 start_codon:yes stop_codon:yes gene_type:complete
MDFSLFTRKRKKRQNRTLKQIKQPDYSLKQLKALAKKVGVTTSGNKKEIAKRILKLRGHLTPRASDGLTRQQKDILERMSNFSHQELILR